MKKVFYLAVLVLIAISPVYAENPEISIRYSDSPGLIRIVIEGMNDEFLSGTKVYQSYSLLKIEFPSEFSFKTAEESKQFDISKRGKSLFVTVAGLQSIKHFTLSDPPRLVIDASIKGQGEVSPKPKKQESSDSDGLSGKKIVLDPGHGGYDIGIVGSDYKEKDIALLVAGTIRNSLKKAHADVSLTRSIDKYYSISERYGSVYNERPDLFISIHISSTPDFVVYYANMDEVSDVAANFELKYRQARFVQRSEKVAGSVARSLRESMKRNVIVRKLPVSILSGVNAPAVLIEMPDGKFFEYSQADRGNIANAVVKGIVEYGRE